jgi:hypothetical protein
MKMYTSSRFSIANQTISTRDSLPFPCLPRTLALCFGRLIGYSLLMGHDLIDRRGLELNKLVAEKILQQPELMDLVRNRLERTLSEARLSESSKDALREWQKILSTHSLHEVLKILTEDSDEGQRLRQSSPFSGILSQRERLEVFRRNELSYHG